MPTFEVEIQLSGISSDADVAHDARLLEEALRHVPSVRDAIVVTTVSAPDGFLRVAMRIEARDADHADSLAVTTFEDAFVDAFGSAPGAHTRLRH